MLSILSQAFRVRCQEAAASHAGINIPLQLLHFFGGNIIRHHSPGGALCREFCQVPVSRTLADVILIQHINQLRESRCNPHTCFILNALHSLKQDFFNDGGEILPRLSGRHFVQVHEHGDERSLAVAGHQCNQLILNRLDSVPDFLMQPHLRNLINNRILAAFPAGGALLHYLPADFPAADIDKRCQMRQRK